jgi:hypothetical protein
VPVVPAARILAASAALSGTAHAQSPYAARASLETSQYADTDHVFVTTPTLSGSVARPTAGWAVEASFLVDVVSAASVDIVSTASRSWQEARHAGTLRADYKPGTLGVTASGAFSIEPDYVSWAGGLLVSQDFAEKNVTVFGGYDRVQDVAGRSGTPFSVFSRSIETNGVKAGVSFVIDRSTIGSALLDAIFVNGDSSDPYRYVPLFAPGTSVPAGASIDTVNALRLSERALEAVPLSRNRYAITARLAHRFASSTLRLEERVYDDTWSLLAQTADVRWIIDAATRLEIGPHLRLHDQAAVSFWQRAYQLRAGLDFPAYRTGDRELGPLMTLGGGGSVVVGIGPTAAPRRWTLGLELEAAYTRFFDDLYLTDRTSTLGVLSFAGEL